MKPLHRFQVALLDALRDPPEGGLSLESLRVLIGASSKSQVAHHLRQLEQRGLLKRNPDNPGDYTVFGENEAEEPFTFLPLLALASCGAGTENDQHVIERFPVRSQFIPGKVKGSFLVRAEGDSMEPRIRHKDIVLVERFIPGRHSPNGKVIVCEEDHECKIKKYAEANGVRMLISENPQYGPHIVSPGSQFAVVGIVRGVLFASID